MKTTDRTWKYFGRRDPYFGVLTQTDFRRERLTDTSRQQFFETGTQYIDFVLKVVHDYLDSGFRPTRALDFGCGVGRLTIALAKVCESVTGVDVSEGMIAEARRNVEKAGLNNVTLLEGDDRLSAVTGSFDFLNSLIVFQHISPRRGEVILQNMLARLSDDGIGVLQFTYGFDSRTPRRRRLLIGAYRAIPLCWGLRNILIGRPFSEPMMEMNSYDINRLLRILQEAGCHLAHVRFTETGFFGHSFYGAILFFQKKQLDPTAFA